MLKIFLPLAVLLMAAPALAGEAKDKDPSSDIFSAVGVKDASGKSGVVKPSGSLIGFMAIEQDASIANIDATRSRIDIDSVSVVNSTVSGMLVEQDAHIYGATLVDSSLDVNRLSISNSTVGMALVDQDASLSNVYLRSASMSANRIDVR